MDFHSTQLFIINGWQPPISVNETTVYMRWITVIGETNHLK